MFIVLYFRIAMKAVIILVGVLQVLYPLVSTEFFPEEFVENQWQSVKRDDTTGSDVITSVSKRSCGCCVQTRGANAFCCTLCYMDSKRSGAPPSESTYPSAQDASTSDIEVGKRLTASCFCCNTSGRKSCCSKCRQFF